MYRYYLCITSAKKMDNFKNFSTHINSCVKRFNNTSCESRNYKHIVEPVIINKDNIELKLESDNELSTPLRALWLFSKLLLEDKELSEYCLGTRFLKPISIKQLEVEDEQFNLKDSDILKLLIDIYVNDKNLSPFMDKLNKNMKAKINLLAYEYMSKRE